MAVDAQHEKLIAERFQKWPQAAINVTFGILVSDCKVVIQQPDVDVLVVEDHALGTNDCRGWDFRRGCSGNSTCPIIASISSASPSTGRRQKGSFKLMQDDVADSLEGRHHSSRKARSNRITKRL